MAVRRRLFIHDNQELSEKAAQNGIWSVETLGDVDPKWTTDIFVLKTFSISISSTRGRLAPCQTAADQFIPRSEEDTKLSHRGIGFQAWLPCIVCISRLVYAAPNDIYRVRMYRKRFAEWGIERKLKLHEVKYMLMVEYLRAKKGKNTSFTVHGRDLALRELHRYTHRKRLKMSAVLEDFSKGNVKPCEWIECTTPSPEVPLCTSLDEVTPVENAYRHWKAMILGTLEARLCYAGETGILWIYGAEPPDQCQTDVLTAIEVFQDHRNYSRSYSGLREMFLLRKGCLLLERVILCSSFLFWIEVLQSIAHLVSRTRYDVAKTILDHIKDLSSVRLSMELPHTTFVQALTAVSAEDFVALTIGVYEILVDIEQSLLPTTTSFTWHSRVSLWRFMHHHGRTTIDMTAFNLLQEGLAMYGPYAGNPMITAIVDESRWPEAELKLWYNAELVKSILSKSCKHSPESSASNNYTDWLSYGLRKSICNSTKGFRAFNGGDLLSARKHWINSLNAPIRGESTLSDVKMHVVLEHLDWLSTYSGIADDDVRWCLWKLVIEKEWQIELDNAGNIVRRRSSLA